MVIERQKSICMINELKSDVASDRTYNEAHYVCVQKVLIPPLIDNMGNNNIIIIIGTYDIILLYL